jgi:DNA-binding NtrC family response regulator
MAPQNRKILLVDDDRDILTVLKMRLELMDFEVSACSDPEEALRIFNGHELVITDQRMDKLRGIELLHRLK